MIYQFAYTYPYIYIYHVHVSDVTKNGVPAKLSSLQLHVQCCCCLENMNTMHWPWLLSIWYRLCDIFDPTDKQATRPSEQPRCDFNVVWVFLMVLMFCCMILTSMPLWFWPRCHFDYFDFDFDLDATLITLTLILTSMPLWLLWLHTCTIVNSSLHVLIYIQRNLPWETTLLWSLRWSFMRQVLLYMYVWHTSAVPVPSMGKYEVW